MSSTEGYTGGPEDEAESSRAPHRVIGTPPPAEERTLLGTVQADTPPAPVRELPADPDDLAGAKRAERIVAALFILGMLAGIGFIAAYIGLPVGAVDAVLRSNLALGTSLAVTLLALGTGALLWVRHLMPDVEIVEQRHDLRSEPADRAAFEAVFKEGTEYSQFVKRPIVRRTLMLGTLPLVAAPLVLLRDMGPLPGTSLRHTVWSPGRRLLVYGTDTPLTPAQFSQPGSMITIVPDGYADDPDALIKATVILIKFRPGELDHFPTTMAGSTLVGTMNWTVDNIVAYSKICTHVGCPVALYEQTTHHILCPCHQSTFDAATGATVIFGPAARPLPQLPLALDAEGYLVAKSDFTQPVGPSFWERG